MNSKYFLFLIVSIFLIFGCSEDSDIAVPRNLQEYIAENLEVNYQGVIACASNAKGNTAVNHIFYYPEEGATDIRYYELVGGGSEKSDFVNYKRLSLTDEAVFGGKLKRFIRSSSIETWCLVTFKKEGVLRISDPIKLKNTSKPTEYSDAVSITYLTKTEPKFTWEDGVRQENNSYFQVISDVEDNFISGTYTADTFFQFYDVSNVTLNINTTAPKSLVEDEIYNFTMMGVSEDNWVNLIIQEQFIPRNLAEYIAVNDNKYTESIRAFAGNANGNKGETYIYFRLDDGAFEYRYYETENTSVVQTDFSNYKRRNLSNVVQFGGKFRRFSNISSDEVWCLVTYISEGKLHISEPIKTKNNVRETKWSTAILPTYTETLKPKFTWVDGPFAESDVYFVAFTKADDTFLSGTFTKDKMFEYYTPSSNVIVADNIHKSTPPGLVLDAQYKFSLLGISADNWVNLVIQKTFITE